ncbi:FtsK/SpoIIIE domain-containing protein [Neobacillus sp.]|uniref:FtsK/SpoIIIE domain-containing protein n=1 Tax=Neobacillus sp. TaxID=2675273 RepID=UPI0028A2194C|nr:FtsK/SpoIIIE domain-containing protein [Neobacillus sp.]
MIKEWLAKQKMKASVLQVFRNADIGISYSYGNNAGKVYPKIRQVKFDYEHKTAICYFSLPTGLDPKEIKKKEYCFHQVFGKNIEIKGEVKEFYLTVYAHRLPSELTYNFELYSPSFEGMALPIVAGVDLNGKLIVFDLVKNPHLLIAGETGSGKSTQLRSIITTLIQAVPPERLELYLCDLKRSEFHVFRQVKHVQGVYVSPSEMMPVFQSLQREMKRRGDILDENEVSHVDDLKEKLPYKIVCIDEVALLQSEKKIMDLVEEISAIGRALGVFIILSMQRPDRKVLDGKLKNNLTVRMGFMCADLINSRIIGTPGSEKIKKEGRMLLKTKDYDLKEIQAPFLSIDKAKKLLEGYRCPKEYKHSKSPVDVLNLKENKETGIFEVLD